MLGEFLEKALLGNVGKIKKSNSFRDDDEIDLSAIVDQLNSFEISGIVYYPSSGLDLNDIHYVNEKKIPEIKLGIPNVFIHSDAMDYYTSQYHNLLNNPVYHCIEGYVWSDEGDKKIFLKRYKRNGLDAEFWFIYFKCFCNETILKSFLDSKMKVDLIFCPVDGITMGMGAGDLCENVPTLFYTLLSKQLGIKYIITDQSSKRIFSFSDAYFSQWISNFNKLHKDIYITKKDVENIVYSTKEIFINDDSFRLCRHTSPGFFIKELT